MAGGFGIDHRRSLFPPYILETRHLYDAAIPRDSFWTEREDHYGCVLDLFVHGGELDDGPLW